MEENSVKHKDMVFSSENTKTADYLLISERIIWGSITRGLY